MKNQTYKIKLKDLNIYFPSEKSVKSTEGLHVIKATLNPQVMGGNICIEYYVEYFKFARRFALYNNIMKQSEFYTYKDVKLMVAEFALNDMQELIEWGDKYCSKEDAETWVKHGLSKWVDEKHIIITNPDFHSASWLTTQELRQCFDDCFKESNGTYKANSTYIEWFGLVSLCEGLESSGEYECRVVFVFDN